MPRPSSTRSANRRTDEVPTTDELLQKPIDELVKEYGRYPLCFELSLLIDEALHKSFPPHLKGKLSYFQRIEGDIRKHVVDGDYICYSILRVCEILRSKDPIFRTRSSKEIAKMIMYRFPKSDMVKELKLLDVGFLSFKLNGDWMAKRICKNLKDGIAAWAPILPAKRVIVDFPEQDIDAERHADGVRSTYIRDLLVRMLEYSGVEVCGKICNKLSLQIVRKDFPEKGGVIRNKRNDSLFGGKKKATCKPQTNNVHEDLAALWCGEYVQKANSIIYVTPAVKEDHSSMCYLGYQTSCDENEKLASLWGAFDAFCPGLASDLTAGSPLSYRKSSGLASSLTARPYFQRAFELGKSFGYSPVAVFECTIRYEYLKQYTYSGCTFEDEEIFGLEGNNFLKLLETRYIIRGVLEKSPHPNLESNKVLVGKEREFGLHLLRFTETKRSETLVLLYEAAEVVLEKGFDLLGITLESSEITYLKPQIGKLMAMDHYAALPVLSQNLSSRFEIFSMTIGVLDSDFKYGNLFGDIRVSNFLAIAANWTATGSSG
ncbi:arginine--tRNA ligase, chloroplastic/mitochondrial [Tanacetum coccineum]